MRRLGYKPEQAKNERVYIMYDYNEAVKNDILEALSEDYSPDELLQKIAEDKEGFFDELYDIFLVSDRITGNASGSYTFNRWEAEENLCHNLDLLEEAAEEFGCNIDILSDGAEACDVTIRCYLLSSILSEVLDDIEEENIEEIERIREAAE